jgi:hypothetical protein
VGGASAEHQKTFALLRLEVEAAINGSTDVLRRKVDIPDFWIARRQFTS